ncbi:MAG TPA: CDP-alcohol phosphatidyltransferase family protein, partial [Herpetosiphonaceae bacterium]|nr:CDP-alcohol phosphatidyltransferase family protein [Herpetosiphonaceae bacterium]
MGASSAMVGPGPMIDKVLRVPKEQVLAPVALRLPDAVHPTVVTGAAFVAGLAASAAAAQQWYGWSIAFWMLNRVLDGLDGTLARVHGKQSDWGGYLDIVLDTVIYAVIPFAIVFGSPSSAAWLSLALLLASFYVNGASWMYLAALLEKRRQGAATQGELTTITMPSGIIEGTETVILYTLFLLFP